MDYRSRVDAARAQLYQYRDVCQAFARDTAEWAELDGAKCYTTRGGGWEETPGNEHGGYDVSWAFHQNDAAIRVGAEGVFLAELIAQRDALIDALQ